VLTVLVEVIALLMQLEAATAVAMLLWSVAAEELVLATIGVIVA